MTTNEATLPPSAPVARLADLVELQADAIVSKVLARSGGGNVTLFAFDAGQELSEHTAPFEALVYVVEGEGEIGVAGEAHRARAGDLVRLPAGVPHWVRAVEPFKMLLVMLREPGS